MSTDVPAEPKKPRRNPFTALMPRNKRARVAIYVLAAFVGLMQVVFVGLYAFSPLESAPTINDGSWQSRRYGSITDEVDFWSKYYPEDNSVPWDDFAIYLLLEYSQSITNLTSALAPALGGHFDIDNDGIVSRKEYNRFLRIYGELGLENGLQQAVDTALDNNWRRDAIDRRRQDARGCALEINSGDGTYVELEASADLQFAGSKPFFIEVWIRPRSGENFGGTIVSKYNRGHRGQFFLALEDNGGVFFHREVSPWGLRSNYAVPPDVFTHIAVGYGGGRSKIYINGTLRGSQREGAQAADMDTNVLVGAIHDQNAPASMFDGTIDELRFWSVDRTQVELESSMYTSLTGLEYGLVGYWTFDECSGGRLRDRMGRHDGNLHGGRWMRSPVGIRTNQEIVQCPEKGRCSIDEVEERKETGNGLVDEMLVQNDYWKRAIKIMETQNKVNKKIVRELLMTVDTLTSRVKWLETQDRIRHEQVMELNTRNVNISQSLASIRKNFTNHLMVEDMALQKMNETAHAKDYAVTNLMAQLADLADEMDAPLPSLAELNQQLGLDISLGGASDTDSDEEGSGGAAKKKGKKKGGRDGASEEEDGMDAPSLLGTGGKKKGAKKAGAGEAGEGAADASEAADPEAKKPHHGKKKAKAAEGSDEGSSDGGSSGAGDEGGADPADAAEPAPAKKKVLKKKVVKKDAAEA